MISLKQKRQSGFTIVELLIVIIIIGILAGLVVTQVLGANQKARDTERKTDLDAVTNQLEAYFAKTGGYPTLDNLNDTTPTGWLKNNEFNMGDSNKAMADPSAASNKAFVAAAAANSYAYIPLPAGCVSPTATDGSPNTGTFCKTFTLDAALENTKDTAGKTSGSLWVYEKTSANQ